MLRRGPRVVLAAVGVAAIAVFAVPALAAPRYGSRALKLGLSGSDVKQLQRYLRQLGLRVRADGVFGSTTVGAVKRFERREHQRADGRVSRTEAQLIAQLVWDGADSTHSARTGGLSPDDSLTPSVDQSNPTAKARISSDGRTAIAPDSAPIGVKEVIAAANRITRKPYLWGGGHGHWEDSGYDCSGSVSYALHGAHLVSQPLDSTGFESWGRGGKGHWITVETNAGHAYLIVAGLRFDTAGGNGMSGPRWRPTLRSNSGFMARHPAVAGL